MNSRIFNASFPEEGNNYPLKDMLPFKYALDLDGMTSAWSAFYWKLYSNCIPIKLASHWEQWYYRELIPYYHYLPLLQFSNSMGKGG